MTAVLSPVRPVALPVLFDAIPQALKDIPRWVNWKFEPNAEGADAAGNFRWTKPPRSASRPGTSRSANHTDAATWSPYELAASAYRDGDLDGLGFVLSRADLAQEVYSIVGVDLDSCRDPVTGVLADWAQAIVSALDSYSEVSPSGTGVRILALGKLPPNGRKKGDVEVYETYRYVTITGQLLPASPRTINERQQALLRFHQQVFPPPPPQPTRRDSPATTLDDEELIARMRTAANASKFNDLWAGGFGDALSHSEADLALLNIVAFWVGPDRERIDRIFRLSALVRRKWEERDDYRNKSIDKALAGRTEFYDPNHGRPNGTSGGPKHGDPVARANLLKMAREAKSDNLPSEEALAQLVAFNRGDPPLTAAQLGHLVHLAYASNGNGNGNGNGQESHEKEPAEPATPPAWDPPLPLTHLSQPMPFPVEVFPQQLLEFVDQVAWATNSPIDFVAIPVLVLAAGCLGASRALGITRTHIQPSILFAGVIGMPGSGKSPSLEIILNPVEAAEIRFQAEHKANLRTWRADDPEARGDRPTLRRLIVDDTTSEALMRTINANSRGLCMVRDELAALIAGFNQYKGGQGSDRQVFLKAWSSGTFRVDRKSNEDGEPLIIRHPCMSIVGGIQPDVIQTFLAAGKDGRVMDDGLLDRFLWSFPLELPAIGERFREVEPDKLELWDRCVQWLLAVKQWPREDGTRRAKIIGLSEAGKKAWVEFTDQHAAELNHPDFPAHQRGPWSKLKGYCARLALVLRYLALACDPDGDQSEEVGAQAVQGAVQLIAYFKAHYLRVAARMAFDPRIHAANHVLEWLRRHPEIERFSQREAHRATGSHFSAPEGLEVALGLLSAMGYIAESFVSRAATGRPPSKRFDVNPLWQRTK